MHSEPWVWGLIGFAIGFDILCLVIAFFVGDKSDRPMNIMSALLGMALSVPVGIMLTPATPEESTHFAAIGQALLTFMSGYLLAKLDRAAEKFLGPDMLLTPVPGFRTAAAVGCFALGVASIYAARLYLPWARV